MRHLAMAACLLAALLLAACTPGCARKEQPPGTTESPTPSSAEPPAEPPQAPPGTTFAKVALVGNVRDALQGRFDAAKFTELKPADVVAALGLGTLAPQQQPGELMVLGDKAYARQFAGAKDVEIVSNAMRANAAFAIAIHKGQRPAALVRQPFGTPRTLAAFLKEQTDEYRVPVAVYGIGEFLSVEGAALSRALAPGENALSKKGREKFFLPIIKRDHEVVAFFGVAISSAAAPFTPGKELSERGVSPDPAQPPEQGLSYCVYAAVLDRIAEGTDSLDYRSFFAAARTAKVNAMFRLMGQSQMAGGTVIVYALDGLARPPKISIEVEGGVGKVAPIAP